MNETALLHKLMIAVTNVGARVFRNHVGLAYQGSSTRITRPCSVKVEPGDVVVYQARQVRAGLCVGSSDAIGWRSVVVTPDMIGRRFAIFTALETKSEDGRETPEQVNFRKQVENAGGIALVVRDIDQSVDEIEQWRGKE